MNAVVSTIILLLHIYSGVSVETDSTEQLLICIGSCRDDQQRLCHQPPNACGACLESYEERNGRCEPVRRRDSVVNAVKKDVMEVNYAINNQSTKSVQQQPTQTTSNSDILFIAVIVAICAAFIVGILIAIVCYCKMKKSPKELSDYDYPGYGSMDYKGSVKKMPSGEGGVGGDRKLAQSAQMYHYQHQKQQMLELEKNQSATSKSGSEPSSDEENEGNEFTVYECPGLATAGEMEVPNPLFAEPLPASAIYPEIPPQPENDDHSSPPLVNGFNKP